METFVVAFFAIRIIIIGIAIGILLERFTVFTKLSTNANLLVGIASTPMIVSFIEYVLGLVFVGWWKEFFVLVPLVIAIGLCMFSASRTMISKAACDCGVYLYGAFKSLFEHKLFVILFVSCMALFIGTFFAKSGMLVSCLKLVIGIVLVCIGKKILWDGTIKLHSFLLTLFIFLVSSSCVMAFFINEKPVLESDRSHYELNASYFVSDRNSWEIDNYSDEKYGSSLRDDHSPLWTVYLADAKLVANVMEAKDEVHVTNYATFWAYFCFCMLLFYVASFIARNKYAGIVSILLFHVYVLDILMPLGSRDAFRFVGLLLLFLFICNEYCNKRFNDIKGYRYIFLMLFSFFAMNGHAGNAYILLGLFVAMLVLLIYYNGICKHTILFFSAALSGMLLGSIKTILIYMDTGRLSSSTMLAFYGTPVVDQLAKFNAERGDWKYIIGTYDLSLVFVLIIGIIALIVMVKEALRSKDHILLLYFMMLFGMLLPLTGVLDFLGYECSRWFIAQIRYRMYFIMLLAIAGAWLLTRKYTDNLLKSFIACVLVIVGCLCLNAEYSRYSRYNINWLNTTISIVRDYNRVANLLATDEFKGDIFTNDQVLLYHLSRNQSLRHPKLLYHIYAKDLIQAKTDAEIEEAIFKLNIGIIILPQNGGEYHDYSLLPFWKYINESKTVSKLNLQDKFKRFKKTVFVISQKI